MPDNPLTRYFAAMTTVELPDDPTNITLSFSHERMINQRDEVSWPLWRMRATITEETGDDQLVGSISLAIVDFEKFPAPFDWLDQTGADMSEVAGEILNLPGAGLKPRLQEILDEAGSSKILILHHANLTSTWRGTGWLGPLLAGLAIEEIGSDCGLAFLLAKPLDASEMDKPTLEITRYKLRDTWEKLGFTLLDGDVLHTSLIHRPFWDGLETLKKHLE